MNEKWNQNIVIGISIWQILKIRIETKKGKKKILHQFYLDINDVCNFHYLFLKKQQRKSFLVPTKQLGTNNRTKSKNSRKFTEHLSF